MMAYFWIWALPTFAIILLVGGMIDELLCKFRPRLIKKIDRLIDKL